MCIYIFSYVYIERERKRERERERSTSFMRNHPFIGPYSSPMPRAIWWPQGWLIPESF